jgi:hypothetical protein
MLIKKAYDVPSEVYDLLVAGTPDPQIEWALLSFQ